jgi:hypothetical protein
MATGNSSSGASGYLRSTIRGLLPWIILALLGLGPLFVCALFGPAEVGSALGLKSAPDWSRALPVASEFYGTDSGAPLVVDHVHRAHLVWAVRPSAGEDDLRYLRLDDRGFAEEEHDLNVGLHEPRKVRLLLSGDEGMHVFLLGLEARGAPSSLFHLSLTDDGKLQHGPTLLSSGSDPCHEYDVATDSSGMIHLFWTEGLGQQRDLYYVGLPPGQVEPEAARVIARGVSGPVARTDCKDRVHLLWEEPGVDEETAELYHTVFTDVSPGISSGVKLFDLPTGVRVRRHGPVLALDEEYGHVVWTQEYRASRVAASVMEGWYGTFELESGAVGRVSSLSLPTDEKPTYVEYDAVHNYEYVVPSRGDSELGSERIAEPSPLTSPREGLVGFSMIVSRGASRESQITNLVFADGTLVGYQLACNTAHWSRLSNLTSDSDGNLHLSWVEGLEPGPSEVYYATTSSVVRDRVDHITGDDLLAAALNTAFSAVKGVPTIPFILLWVLPPLIWTFIASRFLGEGGARSRRGYLALAIAIILYEASKLYFSPGLLKYVPFSLSVPFLPEHWYAPVQALVPVAILGAGLLGVAYVLLRAESRSLYLTCLVFILIDAFLTMIIYGPGLAVMG